jgi:hypothetical protein
MVRTFSFLTVAFEAISGSVAALGGSQLESLAAQAFHGALVLLPVSCWIAHRILTAGDEKLELSHPLLARVQGGMEAREQS